MMNRDILRLAIPNIVSNITVPLLGLVDLALMGHLNSEVYIGAIALGGVIFNFIYWGFGFLRMSTSGFTAQAFGEQNKTETIFTLIYFFGMNSILKLLTSQIDLIENAQPYIIWVILVPLASFSSFIWDGVYIGATASAAMRNALLGATFLVFAPVYYFLNPHWENHALWLAMVLFMFARGAIQTLLFRRSVFPRIQ